MSNQLSHQRSIMYVVNYIEDHLTEELHLNRLAEISTYSSFHFQRLFKELIGETPASYVKRIRLETAAHKLIYEPYQSITDIGLDCGFSSLSYFTTSFKRHFQSTPKEWRTGAYLERFPREYNNSKKSKVFSRELKDVKTTGAYNEFKWLDLHKVKVVDLPVASLVNRHHIGSYTGGIPNVWGDVYRWCQSRDLIQSSTLMVGVPRSNPYITPPEKSLYDCGISVPDRYGEGESLTPFRGGKHVMVTFEPPLSYEERDTLIECYSELYSYWLPQSGFKYLGNPIELVKVNTQEGTLELDISIHAIALPIEPD
ncbi:AraC family transcriptional regulator [Rossellomorea marisflavi]